MKKKIIVEIDKDNKIHGKSAQYSTKQKYEAVVLYKMVGNLVAVGKQLGIPKETMWLWHNQDWWKEIEEEIRQESRAKLGKNLQKVVDKAFIEISDRLENGDWIWDQKSGKMIRKPLGGHTVNQILKDSLDKTFFIEKLKREEVKEVNQEQISETLIKLAKEFTKFAKAKEINFPGGDPIAIYDQREAGLQEREPPLQIEARTDSKEGSSEQSETPHAESGPSPQGGQP